MLFDNQYFAKHKKSNVNHNAPIIFEIMNLSALAITLSNQISGDAKYEKLINLSNTAEFNTIYEELINYKKINGKVLLKFLRVIKSIGIIVLINEVKDEEEIKKIISEVNLRFEIIQSRYNFELNRIPKELKDDYKGKPTIILTEKTDINMTRLFMELMKLKLINKTQDVDIFKGIFGDKEIRPNQRLVWIGNNYSLMVFLQLMMNFTVFLTLKQLYITATRCFVKGNGKSFEYTEISKARSESNIKEAINSAINISLPNSKQKNNFIYFYILKRCFLIR